MPSIDIRFVRGTALSSAMIAFEEGVSMPFAPSHTEARTKDGLFYIGAQNGGVEKLPVGYDGGHVMTLPDGRLADIIGEMEEWITYDLPSHLVGVAFHGKYRGQRQKWFALRFRGEDSDIDLHTHEPEFSDWKWMTTSFPACASTSRNVLATS